MIILVNGEKTAVKAGEKLEKVLATESIEGLLVEVNGTILSPKTFDIVLQDGDQVEYLFQMAGGSSVNWDSNDWNFTGGSTASTNPDWFQGSGSSFSGLGVGLTDVGDLANDVGQAAQDFDGYVNQLSSLTQDDGNDISITAATVLTTQVQVAQSISEMAQGIAKTATDAIKKQAQRIGQ